MAEISTEIKTLFPNADHQVYEGEIGCRVQPTGRFCLAIFEISEKETSLYSKSPVRSCDSCPILTELF